MRLLSVDETWKPEPQKYRDKRTERFADGERVKEFEAFRDQADKADIQKAQQLIDNADAKGLLELALQLQQALGQ